MFLISFEAKNNVFILLLHALAKNTNPKSHFSNIKNHISNFSGKGTIPAQAAYLPPKPGKQPNIRQAAHNTQATGQATEHRESGVGRAKNNENMQDAGVAASN
ncbi:MAG: hypothetical protein ACLSGF_08015 [Alistipes onderdonkii]